MNKRITHLPFLLIVGFSLIVMLAVVIAQYHSQNGIHQLRNGNAQALITFQVDNLLDEIINETYVIEEEAKQLLQQGGNDHYSRLTQTIQKLQKENDAIGKLDIVDDSSQQAIRVLTSLVTKKIAPYQTLRPGLPGNQRNALLTFVNSDSARKLTDSIYITALQVQIALEKNLENTITKNESLSVSVLAFSRIMGFISIAAIAILASIIIRRLLQSFKLIRALEQAKLQAEKVSDIKEQFLANMSHEIRTPVNSVLGFTNLLEKTDMKEEQAQFVELIKKAGQNLLSLINDILDLSKIESGMLQLDKHPFNLKELCHSVEMMFYHQLTEQQLSFSCRIDDNVPPVLVGDKERLMQVLMNLVNNAIKFTKKGGINIHVSLLSKTGNAVRLNFSVKDTGIGIVPGKLQSIFERFEQAEASTTRKYGGTGLGLSIVKNLVNMQGGSIVAKSEYGNGAEFIFDIEFEMAAEGFAAPDTVQFTLPGQHGFSKKIHDDIHVLAAEDNPMNQLLLSYIFKDWGIRYTFADNGLHCIELLKTNHFDLVLMDIQMPEMDGYEAAEKIRKELHSDIPIIAMTANVLPGEKEKCRRIGMNDYIPKPLNASQLQEVIAGCLPLKETGSPLLEKPVLIDMNYLQKTFNNNQFIQEMLLQFAGQYPVELEALKQAVDTREAALVKARSHNLKTTVSTINSHSPLLDCLVAIEKSAAGNPDWQIVESRLKLLLQTRDELITEAGRIARS